MTASLCRKTSELTEDNRCVSVSLCNPVEASWFVTPQSPLLCWKEILSSQNGRILSFVAKLTVLAPCVGSQFGFQKRPLEQYIRRRHSDNNLWFLS